MLSALREGASLQEEAGKMKLKVEESPMLSRVDRPGSRLAPALLDSGLGLSAATPYPESIVTVGNTFYVTFFKKSSPRRKKSSRASCLRRTGMLLLLPGSTFSGPGPRSRSTRVSSSY